MKIGFFLTNSNEGFYNWNQIEKSLFLDAPSIQKGFGHKYIKRFPKKSGIGYNYIYPEDMFRPFKTLLEFFGVKEKKIKDDYEKEGIKKDYGVDQKTYAMHVLEFFTNKEKWNTIFANKAKRDQYKKPVNQNVLKLTNSIAEKKADEQIKTAKEDKERGTALLQKKNSMLNRSLMRKVWGIYSVEGQRVEALENKTAQKEPAENGVFNDSPKTERDNITKEKIKNDYLNRITSIDKKTGEKTFKYDDGRLIKIDKNNNVLYDSLFDQAEPELKATSRKEIEQTAKNVFDTVKNTSNPTFDNASKIIDDIAVKTNMNMVDAAKVKEEVSKLFDKEKEIDEQAIRDYAADEDKKENEADNISKHNVNFTGDSISENERKSLLQNKIAITINKDDYVGKTDKECRDIAKQKYAQLQAIDKDGIHIEFPMSGYRETKQHSADKNVLYVMEQLNDILASAIFMYREPNTDPKKTDTLNMLNYANKINIDGTDYYVRIVVREDTKGNFYYDNDSVEVEKVKANLGLNTEPNSGHHQNLPYRDRITLWLSGVKEEINNKHDRDNKNKLQELINQQRTNLAEVEYLDLKPIENILQQNPAVNDLFLEDDYIEKMNRHNAMLGNQNAKKDFTEEQQKEYDKTKKWNEDYIAESDQEVKEELLKDQLDTVDNPDKDARTKAKFEAIKDLYEETSGKKYEKKTVKPQTTDEMKEEQKKEKEARKKAGLPNPGNNVGDRVSAIDDADTWNPNSENYRFKDTGYIAGSRKELASMFIMERAKRGERIDAHELDFDGLEENPRAAEKLITKSNIFGEVDWDGLREKGMSGSTAFLIDRIYASAGSKPDESNAQARKQYVIALNGLRDRFEDCKTVPEVIDTLKEIREEIRGEYVEIKEMPEYKKITDKMKSLRETINDKRIELEILAEQCRRKAQAEQQKVVEKYIQKAKDEKLARWNTRVSSYNIPEKYKLAFNLEHSKAWSDAWEPHTKAVEDFKQELISKGAKGEDFFRKNDTYGNGTKTYPISWFDYYTLMPEYTELGSLETELDAYVKKMKVAVRLKNPQLEAWKSLGTRFLNILYSDSFAQHKYDCTKGKYDDWGWLEKEVKVTEKKQGKEKKKFEFLVANEITRKGGRTFNITATADLKKAFNLREVQSGNWVLKDPASAEFHVRNAANAFADLADVTGISDDKISLNGRLAMAFGARGTGGRYGAASAHYEPVERVINLTKFRGGGCLGHEWFHAFDNMITSAMTGDNSKSDIYLTNLYHGMTDANKQLLMNYIELKDAALTYTNNYRREQLKHQLEKKGVDMSKVDGFKSTLQIKVQAAFDNLVKAMTTGTADLRMNLEYDGKDYKAMLYNFSDDMLKRYRERFNSYSGSKKPMQLAIVDAGSLDKAVEEINKRFEGFNDSKHLKSKKDWLKLTAAYYDRQPDGNKNGIPLRVSTGKKVSNFLAWANEMDMNENKSYHSTTHEMAARAFSAYLEDTLESMGRKNDYLAYCSDNKYYSSDYKPYPEGEERKRINECFKKLFEVIRSENAIQKSIDFEKAQTKDFSVWHTKDGDIEVQKDANGEWHPVSRTGKKNSRLNDATNNDTSTATTKVGIPVSPQNTSTQTTKNYTRLDKQKSQSAMKYLNKIKTDTIAPREFLIKLKESFGVINLQDSNYITRKTGNKDITLRLSNHNANGEYVRKNESEISIVISLSESKFKNPDKKDIIEYVYKPENLSKEVKDGIIQGLVNWIKTGVYSDSHADSINKSIICHESIDMPDIIFTRDGRLLFKIA